MSIAFPTWEPARPRSAPTVSSFAWYSAFVTFFGLLPQPVTATRATRHRTRARTRIIEPGSLPAPGCAAVRLRALRSDPSTLIWLAPAKGANVAEDTTVGNRAGAGAAASSRSLRHDPALDEPRHLAARPRAAGVLRPASAGCAGC